jgi:hypothetical protein
MIVCILVSFLGSVFAVQVFPVTKDGRQIQLDGFLLEWKKADTRPLGADSSWSWNVINTKEGLTGYFRSEKKLQCKSWTFRFLPCRLSPYQSMEIRFDSTAAGTFYRVTHADSGQREAVVCEWIIPWKTVCHDSAGGYQVGLFAFDACGDTMPPVILTGRLYNPKNVQWGGVYVKFILLGGLMILLFYLQRSTRATRGKFRKRKMISKN